MSASEGTKRTGPFRFLDACRGLAALWVLMAHACQGEPLSIYANPFYNFCSAGQLGVAFFFVISGYCIAGAADSAMRKPKPLGYFLFARLKRIYPPYIASTVLAIAIAGLVGMLANHHVIPPINHPLNWLHQPFKYYFSALTLTQVPFGVDPIVVIYWSLCYEVAFYVIIAIFLIAIGKQSKDHLYLCLNATTIVSLIWINFSPSTCPFPLNLWYQFGIGAMVYMLLTGADTLINRIFFGAGVALTLSFAALHQGPYSIGQVSWRAQALLCVGFAIALIFIYPHDGVLTKKKAIRALELLGAFSYSLYLSHRDILGVLHPIGKKAHLVGHAFIISFLLQIGVGIACGYLFHLLFEKPFLSSRAKVREAEIVTQPIQTPA